MANVRDLRTRIRSVRSTQQITRAMYLVSASKMRKSQDLPLRSQTKHRQHVRFLDLVPAKTDELIERGLRVTHAAFGATRNGLQGGRVETEVGDVGCLRDAGA